MSKLIVAPNSPEAELIILGSMLSSSAHNDYACQHLQSEDFFNEKNKVIFSFLRDMYLQEIAPESQLLIQRMKDAKVLNTITIDYVLECMAYANNSYELEEYVNVVIEKSMRRALLAFHNQSIKSLCDESLNIEEVLDQFHNEISNIKKKKTTYDFFTLKDLATGNKSPLDMSFKDFLKKKKELRLECKDSLCTGLPTGNEQLDKMLNGFGKSNLIIMAARPGVGKTTLALNFAVEIGMRSKMPVGIFSLEMSCDQIFLKLMCNFHGLSYSKISKGEGYNIDDMDKILKQTAENPIIIYESASVKIGDILTASRRLKEIYDVKFIIIDYLQLISGSSRFKNSDSRVNEVSEISRSLKILAKELDLPILCLSQLNRAVESRADKTPMLSDLRESGSIEQDADQVVLLHRPDLYDQNNQPGKLIISIAKNRHGETGKVELASDLEVGRYRPYYEDFNKDMKNLNANFIYE